MGYFFSNLIVYAFIFSLLVLAYYAIRKIKNLKKEGYNSSFTNINPKGMFRVAYGRFKSKKEAMDLLYHIKYNLGGEAWFLKEN